MVASVDHLASAAGVDCMRNGGSAVDAAIAASAVLAVTTQHLCGMGGDLFAIVHRGDLARKPAVLNASGRAGSGADADRLRAAGHQRIPRTGHVSAVPVPGCVDGWVALHREFGRIDLRDVLEPARGLADEGFAASPTLASSARRLFELRDPATGDYTEGRSGLRVGDLVRRPGVARMLDAVARDGRRGFYEGEFGEGLLALGEGEYTPDDLSSPSANWVEPLELDVWGHTLWTVPPNSQGYLTLSSAWLASELDLGDDPNDPRWAHLLIEASRQAAFDRLDVLHEHADGKDLLAEERLRSRLHEIDPRRAADLGDGYAAGGTIALCAVDARDGMAVSLIQSNYAGFGSMVIEPNTRIFLQNRGAGFNLLPGHPAEYGPRRRPPHTLAPALVTAPDGTFDCVLGTMGGDSQPQILLQLLARRYGPGPAHDPAEVIASPRFVLTGSEPGYDVWEARGSVTVSLEPHAPGGWEAGLVGRGHRVDRLPPWSGNAGHAHLIERLPSGALAGAADPRSLGGVALGF